MKKKLIVILLSVLRSSFSLLESFFVVPKNMSAEIQWKILYGVVQGR